jgi:hypothetical protein
VEKRILYKDKVIKSVFKRVSRSGKWTLRISISWKVNDALTMRSFPCLGRYNNEEEAHFHGITYGQRIIDGKVPGVTLEELAPTSGKKAKNKMSK